MDSFLGGKIAYVKIATLVVGVFTIGFLGHSFVSVGSEEAFLSAVIICFIITFLWTMGIIVGLIKQEEDMIRKADMLFHMVACVFYLITLIVFFVSLVDKGKGPRFLWERVFAFILGLVNTILYGFGGYLLYKT